MTAKKKRPTKKPAQNQKSNAANEAKKQAETLKKQAEEKAAEGEQANEEKAAVVEAITETPGEAAKPVEVATVPNEAAKPVEVAKASAQKVQDPDEHFKIMGKPMFWRNTVFIPNVGHINGAVKVGHMQTFFKQAPKSVDLDDWMFKTDLVKVRIDKAKAKMKARAGQKE